MLSERNYWILLIFFLSGFALLIWLWLIPYGIVEYNLGVNLFTSSIFMALTVVFMSLLIDLREKRRWKSVENGVYQKIGWHMKNILSEFTYLLNFPPELLEVPADEDWSVAYRKSLIAQAKYLAGRNVEEIKLSHVGENYLSSEGGKYLDIFCRKELEEISEIEMKYGRFLKPSLILLIMKLESDLRGIVDLISVRDEFDNYLSLIVYPIYDAVKHICKIHETEVEIV